MNDNLNTDNYHYQVNQQHCDDVMRAADQQRLAKIAAGESKAPRYLLVGLLRSVRQFFNRRPLSEGVGHKTRKTLHHTPSAILVAVLLSCVLLASTFPGWAQPVVDPGQPEPDAQLVHYGVGMYFQARGNHERAIQELTVAIAALPLEGNVYVARADSYVSLKQYAAAISDYTRALELNSEDSLTCAKRAFAFAALGDLDAAQQDFEHVISID